MHKTPIHATLLCLLALGACAKPSMNMPKVDASEVAEEEALQKNMMAKAEAQGGMPRQWGSKPGMQKQFDRVAKRIEDAGAKLCREMGLPEKKRRCYYYFELSRDKDINASADGQGITINAGMMRFVANDDELGGVMGHELAHNFMDHRGSKQTNAYIGAALGAVLDIAAAAGGVNTGGNFMDAGVYASVASYSPEFEREADYVGLYITARAGYDMRKVAAYWRRLSVALPESASGGITHPSNPERFVAIQKTIAEIEEKKRAKLALLPDYAEIASTGE